MSRGKRTLDFNRIKRQAEPLQIGLESLDQFLRAALRIQIFQAQKYAITARSRIQPTQQAGQQSSGMCTSGGAGCETTRAWHSCTVPRLTHAQRQDWVAVINRNNGAAWPTRAWRHCVYDKCAALTFAEIRRGVMQGLTVVKQTGTRR